MKTSLKPFRFLLTLSTCLRLLFKGGRVDIFIGQSAATQNVMRQRYQDDPDLTM